MCINKIVSKYFDPSRSIIDISMCFKRLKSVAVMKFTHQLVLHIPSYPITEWSFLVANISKYPPAYEILAATLVMAFTICSLALHFCKRVKRFYLLKAL